MVDADFRADHGGSSLCSDADARLLVERRGEEQLLVEHAGFQAQLAQPRLADVAVDDHCVVHAVVVALEREARFGDGGVRAAACSANSCDTLTLHDDPESRPLAPTSAVRNAPGFAERAGRRVERAGEIHVLGARLVVARRRASDSCARTNRCRTARRRRLPSKPFGSCSSTARRRCRDRGCRTDARTSRSGVIEPSPSITSVRCAREVAAVAIAGRVRVAHVHRAQRVHGEPRGQCS